MEKPKLLLNVNNVAAQRAARCCYPVAVPGVRLADGAAALHTDRCHSFPSLHLPQAALGSLPRFSLASPVQIAVAQ